MNAQVSLKYAFESKNDLFLILDLMTGGESKTRVDYNKSLGLSATTSVIQ